MPQTQLNRSSPKSLAVIGWRETVALPALGIAEIKAKIDTGARSSALHAFNIEPFQHDSQEMVRFQVHPQQRNSQQTVTAAAPLLEYRQVKNSGGQAQLRPVIQTIVGLGEQQWTIELTLTNRDAMGFRMLLGRQAVRRRFLVDAGSSFLHRPSPTHRYREP
ncbi:MAG: ATP-dependent zinc protease [Cyanophyceae cyanobacterium]